LHNCSLDSLRVEEVFCRLVAVLREDTIGDYGGTRYITVGILDERMVVIV